jgi:hypothetical protein
VRFVVSKANEKIEIELVECKTTVNRVFGTVDDSNKFHNLVDQNINVPEPCRKLDQNLSFDLEGQ